MATPGEQNPKYTLWIGTAQGAVIGDHNIVNQTFVLPRAEPVIPAQAPRAPGDFVGRETEIAAILKAAERGNASISGVQGMGGVGKTALALVAAGRLKDAYPDGQIFLDLRGVSEQPLAPKDALEHVIHSYQPELVAPDSPDDLRGLYLSLLSGKRALLIFDNARDAAQVRELIPPAGCLMLVTSRRHFTLAGMETVELDRLPPDQAVELIREIAGQRSGDQAGELAEACGCLPLAVRDAAGLLRCEPGLTPEALLRRLSDARRRLGLLDDERGATVETVLRASYEALPPAMKAHWRRLAVFAGSFACAAAAAVLGLSEDEAHEVLGGLGGYSLVEYHAETCRYRLHDLYSDFALNAMDEEEREELRERHATYFFNVLKDANLTVDRGGEAALDGLFIFDRERENIFAGQSWAAQTGRSTMVSHYAWFGITLLNLRLTPKERIRWLSAGLTGAMETGKQNEQAAHLIHLGVTYTDLGETLRGIDYQKQALSLTRLIRDRHGEANALSNLGAASINLGNAHQAVGFLEEALVIHRDNNDRKGEGTVLGNLGLCYIYLGEVRRSIETLEQALQIAVQLGDRRIQGVALGNLGRVFVNLGEVQRGIKAIREVLEIAEQLDDRWMQGLTLANLAQIYSGLGDPAQAKQFYERSMQIAQENSDQRLEGLLKGAMGSAHDATGQWRQAIEFYEQDLAITGKTSDSRNRAGALGLMGETYLKLGETRRAIEHLEQAYTILHESGDQHGAGTVLGSLGNAYADLGERDKAIAYYQQAMQAAHLFEDRLLEGAVLTNLGVIYIEMDKTHAAIPLLKRSIEIDHETGNLEGEALNCWNLGQAYCETGNPALGIPLMEVRLKFYREIGHEELGKYELLTEQARKEAANGWLQVLRVIRSTIKRWMA